MVQVCGASLGTIVLAFRLAGLRTFHVTENGAMNSVSLRRFEAPIIASDSVVFFGVTKEGRGGEGRRCLSHSEI
jgi:hypothetical protein